MFTPWNGPVRGKIVSHVWSSFPSCLFLEFGKLTPGGTYTNRRGQVYSYQPKGEFGLTTMDSWPDWSLLRGEQELATWESRGRLRHRALKKLIGRKLQCIELDRASNSSRLTFSGGLRLVTTRVPTKLKGSPHWLCWNRVTDDKWSFVSHSPQSTITSKIRQYWTEG